MRGTSTALLLFSLATLAFGKVDFEKLPDEINRYLETKILTPEFKETVDLIRQKKTMKTYSTRFDMKLMDGLSEEKISKV